MMILRHLKDLDSADTTSLRFRRIETFIVLWVLVLAVGFNLVHLYPEVAVEIPDLNDAGMHLLLTQMASDAISQGQNITDPWQRTMNTGFPMFHYYQHLPHVSVALVHFFTFGVVPLVDLFNWAGYLFLSIFPLSIFWSMHRFGFDRMTAAMGGLVSSLVATNFLYGFGYTSYVWHGQGLYPQIWAMVFLPPALAEGHRVLRDGRGYFLATVLLVATLMSHLIYGYMAFVTLGLLSVLQPIRIADLKGVVLNYWCRWKRLLILVLLVMAVTSYFLVPIYLDRQFLNLSVWDNAFLYDSFGHAKVLKGLVEGKLFDFGRFPSFTILVIAGLVMCALRWREERYLIPVAVFLLWLLLYFGRATWGPLVNVLPVSSDLHMHRFIAGVHLGGIFLAAIVLGAIWRWTISRSKNWHVSIALVLTLLILLPAYNERIGYLEQNGLGIKQSQAALAKENQELTGLFETIKQLPPGRVWAGQEGWGDDYTVAFQPINLLLHAEGLDMMGDLYHRFSLTGDIVKTFDETRWEQYDLYNVRYVVAPEGRDYPGFVKPVQLFGRHQLYQIETTGYFDLVGSDISFAGDRTEFYPAAESWLASGLPRVKQHPELSLGSSGQRAGALPLSEAVDVIPSINAAPSPSRGEVVSEDFGSDFYEANVEVVRDSWLMLKVTYHPNWRATIDGVEADVSMLMPSFMGIQLSPGSHQVRLEYQPRLLRSILLYLGLLALPLIFISERWGSRLYSRFRPMAARWLSRSVGHIDR